ncbi:MAG: C-GCAxxG-C-C family protein [Actinomycetota bacterium]
MVNQPLDEGAAIQAGNLTSGRAAHPEAADIRGGMGFLALGVCAAPVLRRIREEIGRGNHFLEDISIALDGGVGLSGGLCGALAGALLSLGEVWGIDPQEEGLLGTLGFFVQGHLNLYAGKGKRGLWAMGNPLVRGFRRRFGSLECHELTGREFASRVELEKYVKESEVCREIMDWCVKETVRISK